MKQKEDLMNIVKKNEQLTEHVEALFVEPLAYQIPPLSPDIPETNSENQGN
jgi:hypothetical protein